MVFRHMFFRHTFKVRPPLVLCNAVFICSSAGALCCHVWVAWRMAAIVRLHYGFVQTNGAPFVQVFVFANWVAVCPVGFVFNAVRSRVVWCGLCIRDVACVFASLPKTNLVYVILVLFRNCMFHLFFDLFFHIDWICVRGLVCRRVPFFTHNRCLLSRIASGLAVALDMLPSRCFNHVACQVYIFDSSVAHCRASIRALLVFFCSALCCWVLFSCCDFAWVFCCSSLFQRVCFEV